MRRFIFEDSVLLDDLNTSKDILNYLKEKKNELLVYSSLKYDELNKEIKDAKLDAYIDVMIPHINEELFNDYFTKSSFFNTIRNSKEDLIKELSNIEKYIGDVIDFVNFRAYSKEEIKKRLNMADLIYIVGGKQHLLEKLFRETDTIDIIKNISKTKVIMGTSAGSIVLGRKITSEKFWEERYPKDKELAKTHEELNLVDFNIIPHYMREDHKKWTKDFFERVLADNEFKVYAIKDSQAVVYNDGKIEFIGGTPDIFGKK